MKEPPLRGADIFKAFLMWGPQRARLPFWEKEEEL